ncbi:hypothetical protein Pelo_17342 [Pelomyxa schiedti]|nr:hypothetical protein Pelo_17342 [Pelomyxa schiedti]
MENENRNEHNLWDGLLQRLPGHYDTLNATTPRRYRAYFPLAGMCSILLLVGIIGLMLVSVICWFRIADVIVNETTSQNLVVYNANTTTWFPNIALAAENDLLFKYLEVNFSVVTIFNATRQNRTYFYCSSGVECTVPHSPLTFICPPPDCGAMGGIPGTEKYTFTRAELVWRRNVTKEVMPELYSTRLFYAINATQCAYKGWFKQNCEPHRMIFLEWVAITDLNVVPILDNYMMPSHVEDSNRWWPEVLNIIHLGYPVENDVWHVEDVRDHYELKNLSASHRNSVLSVNIALTPYLTFIYRQHSHLADLVLEIGAALGLLKLTGVIAFINGRIYALARRTAFNAREVVSDISIWLFNAWRGTIQIRVQNSEGISFVMEVSKWDTVAEVLTKIKEEKQVETKNMCLYYRTKTLENTTTLCKIEGFSENSLLYLLPTTGRTF